MSVISHDGKVVVTGGKSLSFDNLISMANETTGQSDTTLTDAVQSLVDGFGGGGIIPTGNKAITATTSTQTGIDVTNYATVSVAPTPSETKSVTANGDVTPTSGKLLSKVSVNVPTGTARTSADLTVSGATVTVPAGLYSAQATKSVASGSAGTPSASKGTVTNNSVTVTPSVTNTTGYIVGGTKTGTGVTVSASELVSGNRAFTPTLTAQTNLDVKNYATASVSAITKELLANLDSDFVAENIKKDVNLFGLVGTLEGDEGGATTYSITPTTQTFTHNQWVNLSLDIAENGDLSVRNASGGGTVNNPRISTSMSTTFDASTVITKIDIPKAAGDYTLPVVIWWDNTYDENPDDHTAVAEGQRWVLNYTVVATGGGGISEIFGCSKFIVGSCTQAGSPSFFAPYPSDIFTDINKISILAITKPSLEWDAPYFTAIAYIKRDAVIIKGYVTNDSTSFTAYSSMSMRLYNDQIAINMGTTYGIVGQPYYYVMWQED